MEELIGEIGKLSEKSRFKKFWTAFKTKEQLVLIRDRFHIAVERFEVRFITVVMKSLPIPKSSYNSSHLPSVTSRAYSA